MILDAMLQRLYSSLVSGPSMNARPHNARQRVDLMELAAFAGQPPAQTLPLLLEQRKLEFAAKVPAFDVPKYPEAEWSADQKQARDASARQEKLLKKLRDIAEQARDYVNDHGDSCLALGFPLLSLPGTGEEGGRTSRILAPMLFMPVELQVRTASRRGVTLQCVGEGADLLVANPALIAWLERQTGKPLSETLFLDEEGADPWREVENLLTQVSSMLTLDPPASLDAHTLLQAVPATDSLPKTAAVVPSAVLGLFPLSNQDLLRDTRWMKSQEASLHEPVSAFLKPQALHQEAAPQEFKKEQAMAVTHRDFVNEWQVTAADPCQANAVLAAREAKALVVHGPPGTGKSQTITNMIADHLARGQRVLFVCDKRTALDVVKYRLDAVGLGDLCGVVHDPSSDRRDFYMGLRSKLENLAETPLPADPRLELQRVNDGLAVVHAELDTCRRQLHAAPEDGTLSFHELMGAWLDLTGRDDLPAMAPISGSTLADVEKARTAVDETARRAARCAYGANVFRAVLGITLPDLMARSNSDVEGTFVSLHEAAQAADSARPGQATLAADQSFAEQAEKRHAAAAAIKALASLDQRDFARAALAVPPARRAALQRELREAAAWLEQIASTPLDRALASSVRGTPNATLAQVNLHITSLTAWEAVADSFFKKLFAGQVRKSAQAAMALLGLPLETAWQQALTFYRALKLRLLMGDLLGRIDGSAGDAWREDDEVQGCAAAAAAAWQADEALKAVTEQENLPALMASPQTLKDKAEALDGEALWAQKLQALADLAKSSGLFSTSALTAFTTSWCTECASSLASRWLAERASIEDVVRLESALNSLPQVLQSTVAALAAEGTPADTALMLLTRDAMENSLRSRLSSDASLAAIDGERVEAAFATYHDLTMKKTALVREYVRWIWLQHQKSRLLSSTGTQLNRNGSSLRQRLYVKGRKALKLRQMLATGQEVEDGDPIYDLCPVWMASPSTVAQIFPRQPIFEVVIFDEASQCRLEEALPVLLRGQRVVIAGDQKQLPPTRFFESTLADSGDSDAETAEELFYQQQQDAEDLLSAALNLDVREAYLDVHYRSRNEDLIGFSNHAYYGSRLQPIPGHPRNKALSTPIRLHRVDGVYHERTNIKEAEAAATLVAELLAEAQPPSIGVACFNLTQREAILEALDNLAGKDGDFARRIETARQRKGRDSFEGLFVKNLENVQGDERDVMIICTTFGPDSQGKFRRNFGALSQREGGRRLNVLVTRAREAIHVLTSIPTKEYGAVEPLPPGVTPNGRLQLYAYLRYAEQLARLYVEYQDRLEQMRRDTEPELKTHDATMPSRLASALGGILLRQHQTGSHVHWGNDGFSVDVACIHPHMPADVTVGVLTDFSRYHKTPDPVAWDLFRTQVLRGQGWQLERLWSPVLFRRRQEMVQRIHSSHERLVHDMAAARQGEPSAR